jgi:hypothetical protein
MRRVSRASALAAVVAALAAGPGFAVTAPLSRTVESGSTWLVAKTTRLASLTVGSHAVVRAPAGDSLTLTVGGVETDLKPGTYRGDVVLTVTRQIVVQYRCKPGPNCGKLPAQHFRAAIYVRDGRYEPARSVSAAVVGGAVSGRAARRVSITSRGAGFNGIAVTGASDYTIDKPRIDLTGNGGNDFDGFASGIMSSGHARVLVEGADITTRGVTRGAIFVGDDSTMTVNDSTIRVYNGTLPPGYKFTLQLGKMLEVPWMLGITGNDRATLLVADGTAYYNNDRIISQGWGALSTDGVKRTRMYVRNSTIETLDSGYGSYSLGNSRNYFSHCRFRVAGMALIMANGGSGTFTSGTVVDSKRFGVIVHGPDARAGTLVIDGDSVFNTASTTIQVKGTAAHIVLDHAALHAGNGILLQAMLNDDPFAPAPAAGSATAVTASLNNVALRGDIIDSRTAQGDMRIALRHASLQGAISTATALPATEQKPTESTYYLIGDVKNILAPATGPYGLALSLDGSSSWTVAKSSYLTRLTLAEGARVIAPRGYEVHLQVDGNVEPLRAGRYLGRILLDVSKSAR